MRSVQVLRSDAHPRRGRKRAIRFVMRVVMPLLMVAFGTYTVVNGGYEGLVTLLPIFAAHVVGFLVINPLWVLFRCKRVAAQTVED